MLNITFVLIGAIILTTFLVSAVSTGALIPVLKRKHFGQNIREEGPQSHMVKAGTPSMGGLAIIFAAIIVTIVATIMINGINSEILIMLLGFLAFGFLGFWDDFTKVIKKRNLGLRAWQKLVVQLGLSALIALYMAKFSLSGTNVYIPFASINIDFGIWYVPFVTFVLVAMTNAVNLTDGLDGLAAGVTAINALFFAVAATAFSFGNSMIFCGAICGACLGFLVFNKNPAKVFMGDTGSLALGGAIAIAAISMNMTLLLPVAGLVYVLEALSVMIQVASFKTTGKRVFKMAPLHHHFELCGMKEKSVVALFWILSIISCVIAMLAL